MKSYGSTLRLHLKLSCYCFQAEDGIRGLVRSRGLGDVYKRQAIDGIGHGGGSADHHRGDLAEMAGERLSLIHI